MWVQTCCVSIAAEGPEAKRCLPDSEKLPQSPTRASRRLPSAPTFMGRKKLPCTGRFKSRRRLQGRNTHTPAFRPAATLPRCRFTRFLILRPKHVKQGQGTETEGTTRTTLWVVAFHLNCYLHRARRACEERGERRARKGYLSSGRGERPADERVKPREKP